MKLQLLPSTIDDGPAAFGGQHFTCFIINDRVAIDAGSLATSVTDLQRAHVRDIVLTHAHLDHIAGLPLFIDDLFATLTEPVRVHAAAEVIEVLERDVFNWSVYPRFSELVNDFGPVMEYREFTPGRGFTVAGLDLLPIGVNHRVPSSGFIISGGASIAMTGDTADMDEFWREVNACSALDALFIECAFPDRLSALAETSFHLTPSRMFAELEKFAIDCPVFVSNLKPAYRAETAAEIRGRERPNTRILEVGRVYEF